MIRFDAITKDVPHAIAPGGDDPRLVVIDSYLGTARGARERRLYGRLREQGLRDFVGEMVNLLTRRECLTSRSPPSPP